CTVAGAFCCARRIASVRVIGVAAVSSDDRTGCGTCAADTTGKIIKAVIAAFIPIIGLRFAGSSPTVRAGSPFSIPSAACIRASLLHFLVQLVEPDSLLRCQHAPELLVGAVSYPLAKRHQ